MRSLAKIILSIPAIMLCTAGMEHHGYGTLGQLVGMVVALLIYDLGQDLGRE